MEAALDVDRRVLPKHDPARVDQVETGPGDGGGDLAVDGGLSAAGDPADHIVDYGRAAEGGDVTGRQTELPKAVEEVAADLLAEIRGDRVVRPGQRLRRREAAIDRDILRRGHLRHESRQRADANESEVKAGLQSHRQECLRKLTINYAGHDGFCPGEHG